MGIGEGRRVGDGRGVEDDDVRGGAGLETAAVPETELPRGQAGHLANRLGKRQEARSERSGPGTAGTCRSSGDGASRCRTGPRSRGLRRRSRS